MGASVTASVLVGMAKLGLDVVDVAARGVLIAFEEALQLLDDASPSADSCLITRLLHKWEAEVPSGLLAVCMPRRDYLSFISEAILEARAFYLDIYLAAGLKVP